MSICFFFFPHLQTTPFSHPLLVLLLPTPLFSHTILLLLLLLPPYARSCWFLVGVPNPVVRWWWLLLLECSSAIHFFRWWWLLLFRCSSVGGGSGCWVIIFQVSSSAFQWFCSSCDLIFGILMLLHDNIFVCNCLSMVVAAGFFIVCQSLPESCIFEQKNPYGSVIRMTHMDQ